MQTLFVSRHYPFDLESSTQGIYKRMFMFIDALATLGEVNLLFFVPSNFEVSQESINRRQQEFSEHWKTNITIEICKLPPDNKKIKKLSQKILGIFNFFNQTDYIGTTHPQSQEAYKSCLAKNPDLVFIFCLSSMPVLMKSISTTEQKPILFDLNDIEHIRLIREVKQAHSPIKTRLNILQIPSLVRGEQQAICLSQKTFVCSEDDRNYLKNSWDLPNIISIPNAVKIPNLQPISTEPTLLLLGSYYYPPNRAGADFLIEKVWPYIYATRPDAKLIIAGNSPEYIRSFRKKIPGVEFTGFVDNLDSLYQRSRIVCCPIFSGGGTRVKMIEAAAYGKPIVATRIGSEGLMMQDGQEFLERNHSLEFAQACLDLLENDELCQQLGNAARSIVIQYYDRSKIIDRIRENIDLVIKETKHKPNELSK